MPTTAIHPEPVLRRVEVAAPGAADEFAARPEQINIATEHVSILYGEKVAVRDVSLTVQACSILALIVGTAFGVLRSIPPLKGTFAVEAGGTWRSQPPDLS